MEEKNWLRIYNALFPLINNQSSASYYSGGRYISAVRGIDPYFPDYTQYIDLRRSQGLSTTRKDYYLDILLSFKEPERASIIEFILDSIASEYSEKVKEIRAMLVHGVISGPSAIEASSAWGVDRLTAYLERIDVEIDNKRYNSANTLIYTCLEGILKEFALKEIKCDPVSSEITALGKIACDHIRKKSPDYPEEVTALLKSITHAVNRTRDAFSDSHYDKMSDKWVAVFLRDCVNSVAKMLLSVEK